MFISLAPPPLPILEGIRGAGELCQRDGVAELCQRQSLGFDPTVLVGGVLGPIATVFKSIQDTKVAKREIGVQTAQLKAANTEAARAFAMQQAEAIKAPAEAKLLDQKLALIAIGSVALIVAGVFLISTVKKG